MIVEVLTEDDNGAFDSHMYSTVNSINSPVNNEIGVPLIKASSKDDNADGLIDQVELHLELKSAQIGKRVRNVRVIGTVDYSLRKMVTIDMIGLFQFNIDTPSGAASIKSNGELAFVQASPVHVDS